MNTTTPTASKRKRARAGQRWTSGRKWHRAFVVKTRGATVTGYSGVRGATCECLRHLWWNC